MLLRRGRALSASVFRDGGTGYGPLPPRRRLSSRISHVQYSTCHKRSQVSPFFSIFPSGEMGPVWPRLDRRKTQNRPVIPTVGMLENHAGKIASHSRSVGRSQPGVESGRCREAGRGLLFPGSPSERFVHRQLARSCPRDFPSVMGKGLFPGGTSPAFVCCSRVILWSMNNMSPSTNRIAYAGSR